MPAYLYCWVFIRIIYQLSYMDEGNALQLYQQQIIDWFTLSPSVKNYCFKAMEHFHFYVYASKPVVFYKQYAMALVLWIYFARPCRQQ